MPDACFLMPFPEMAQWVHICGATKEDVMRYVVRHCGEYREAARQLAELRAARRELQAARRELAVR